MRPRVQLQDDCKRDEDRRGERDRQSPLWRAIHGWGRRPLNGLARIGDDDAVELRRRLETVRRLDALLEGLAQPSARAPLEIGLELLVVLGVAHGLRPRITLMMATAGPVLESNTPPSFAGTRETGAGATPIAEPNTWRSFDTA